MKIDNNIFNKYKKVVDEISLNNEIDINIKHLLYVIIPAFIYKYGFEKEKLILKCLKDTIFLVSNKNSLNQEAFFDRKIFFVDKKYKVQKYIVINGLIKDEYIYLIDSIVHEFNHALNSMNNEVFFVGKGMRLRTGLSYSIYNSDKQSKSNSYLLEEVINTRQSEEIISIIYNFDYSGDDNEISNLLSTINREKKKDKYNSNAYSVFMECCKKLLNNKTFIKTIEMYRLNGEIESIEKWFDNICGEIGYYDNLIELLVQMDYLIRKYEKAIFKERIKSNIKNIMKKIDDICEIFDNATVYR